MLKHILILFVTFSISTLGLCQQPLIINSEGVPPITGYKGEDYGGHNQVWDITQDDRGLIYLATSYGMHEYDGVTWRKIQIPEGTIPRCFTMTDEGVLYVAGIGICGYLTQDSLGVTVFKSLGERFLGEIPRIEFAKFLDGQVHLAGWNSISVLDITMDTLLHFDTNARSYPNFIFQGTVGYKVGAQGIRIVQGDTLASMPGGEFFNGLAVSDFISVDDAMVGVSPRQELYYFDGDTAYIMPQKLPAYFDGKYPYKLNKLSDQYYAISYLSGGLLVVDNLWEPVLHIDENHGINQEVFKSFLDRDQNLWLATNYGVYIIELGSAYSSFGQASGISGHVTDFEVRDEQLYVATTTGLFVKEWKNLSNAYNSEQKFEQVAGSDIYNDDILSGKGPLLLRAYTSVGQIYNGQYEKLYTKSETQSEITFLKDSTQALALGASGASMLLLELSNDQWELKKVIDNSLLPTRIYNLCYDWELDLFWGSNTESLFSFQLDEETLEIVDFVVFEEDSGLEKPGTNWPIYLNGRVFFSTEKGLHRFDASSSQFVKSDIFQSYFEGKGLLRIAEENNSTFWYLSGDNQKGKIVSGDVADTMRAEWKMFNFLPPSTNSISWNEKGTMLGLTNEIGFLQRDKLENYHFRYPAMIRSFEVISGMDTTLYSGVFTSLVSNDIRLEPDQRDVRFSFAVPYYRHPDIRDFQFQLVGFDDQWSNWTEKTEKEYTNLPPGEYVFRVKARNAFLSESEAGEFGFVIETPWHQTLWMYGLYLLLFVGLVYLIVDWNSQRLKDENLKLEGIIEDRTTEIRDQKETIEKALKERESLLKEIHHRVKNNLQIIASLLYLQSGKFENEDFKKVLEEGQGRVRSMALIHQKLYENDDLKSIPFGEYLQELIGEIKASFGHEMEKVKLDIKADDVQFDVETAVPLGLIINELATNAFKYAFEGLERGSFSIALTKEGEHFVLNVSDDGKGMPSEIDIKKTRSLGLRLVKMLSVQLEAEYAFESNEGTHFIMKFAA
ncbi:MAG: histidine kinase dimerization/phosphoacceptor domain -containing protein [Cyclobacteriaceae bacterium]